MGTDLDIHSRSFEAALLDLASFPNCFGQTSAKVSVIFGVFVSCKIQMEEIDGVSASLKPSISKIVGVY